ncbi:invasion associated locus B family protein [Pseudoduganella namucuonensis]|uniref:Invasion protein IalB, involved in pathogenesis n=1 Tax=Pseudoduganella namucuonensis TaxID=1035707 RepID=A0A1I7IK73_9BURK|nr:invasion associated locus B family protein [Pseudoduganella namucuonensis]SFU73309.1 Invasion protein IalB, involved in pathogenesis [Pseudoduganella namucuonensis]
MKVTARFAPATPLAGSGRALLLVLALAAAAGLADASAAGQAGQAGQSGQAAQAGQAAHAAQIGQAGQAGKLALAEKPRVTREARFDSWGLTCAVSKNEAGQPEERCMISQLVYTNPQKARVVLGVSVDYGDSSKVPTMRARFSPAAVQKAGIGVKIDAQPEMRLAISDCNEQRCEAVGRLSPEVLKLWRNGKMAQLAFLQQGGKQMLLPVSLTGFGNALTALGHYPAGGAKAGGPVAAK